MREDTFSIVILFTIIGFMQFLFLTLMSVYYFYRKYDLSYSQLVQYMANLRGFHGRIVEFLIHGSGVPLAEKGNLRGFPHPELGRFFFSGFLFTISLGLCWVAFLDWNHGYSINSILDVCTAIIYTFLIYEGLNYGKDMDGKAKSK